MSTCKIHRQGLGAARGPVRSVILSAILALIAAPLFAAPNVTNTVMMVDQRGNLNVEGVATVADVASNAVNVAIANQAARTARETALQVNSEINGVVENIMSNNVVIYRRGFADAFSALVVITDNDKLIIAEARWIERTAARIVVEVDYVCTADVAALKPLVFHHNTLSGGASDFLQLPDANITTPVYHATPREVGGETFAGYYTITATIPNPAGLTNYFLWIAIDGDTPAGDGATLDLPNGVTGGATGDYSWGGHILTFTGGVLTGVRDE